MIYFSLFQIKPGSESNFLDMFYPILKGIQSSGQSEEFDLNQIHEVVLKEDGLTYLSANILRNQLRGLSEVQTGHRHIFKHCVIKDFSPTGAARTFALDLQTLIRNELEDERHPGKAKWEPYKR